MASDFGQYKQKFGNWGEKVAAWYLIKKGYKILDKHYTCRFGEIDLIAKDGEEVVFVEVKTRQGINTGLPEEAVNYHKLSKLKRAIFTYLSQNPFERFRMDVIGITRQSNQKKMVIRHYRSVFMG